MAEPGSYALEAMKDAALWLESVPSDIVLIATDTSRAEVGTPFLREALAMWLAGQSPKPREAAPGRLEYRGECLPMGATLRLAVGNRTGAQGADAGMSVTCPFSCADGSHPLQPVTETEQVVEFLRQRAARYREGSEDSTVRAVSADVLATAAQDIADGRHHG